MKSRATILSGKPVRDEIAVRLQKEIASFKVSPTLAIVQVGNDPQTNAYIGAKKSFAEKIGAKVVHMAFPLTATEVEVGEKIVELNKNSSIHGIILQLPVPKDFHKEALLEKIDPKKDVDGLTSASQKKLEQNDPSAFIPATAKGIMHLLNYYKVQMDGVKAVVMGRSALVGIPTALCLSHAGTKVQVVHSKTEDPEKITKEADILIVAIGKAGHVGAQFVREGQTVIDVGITAVGGPEEKRLLGDVNAEEVSIIVGAISPVPGGVGMLTVSALFENLCTACKNLIE